ncbi:endolytic transglycosylase MltG [Lederbergia sp. NSJ-179]|uniref:endolytic transglycosylase MltG n=1 Tax=Lederbergia sp. NSJ-179 TaxID=2931402 RepID=UPI001FD466F1|nr:endolytic transglycosylase MltG [Lederbergia sp. NSJ-179]MCJ7841790.1 endolytic transglycosylase MltG [Lederbergia sp. NSJ-179]
MTNKSQEESNKTAKKMLIKNNLVERGNEARIIRKIVAIIALVFILAAGGMILGGYLYIKSALKPLDSENQKQKEVEVPIGSSTTSIGNLLEEKKIIKNGTIFKYYVKFNNISGFQAGNYKFSPSMTLKEITDALQTGKLVNKAVFKITVPEGLQLDQIAEIIAKNTDYSAKEIMEKLDDPKTVDEFAKKYPEIITEDLKADNIKHPFEGYLYPATYSFYEEKPSLDSIIDTMIKQTKDVLADFHGILAEKDMNVHELLTMASLIEKEATAKADRHKIASVFFNRMEAGMPLQTDPTIAYALGEHKVRTMYEDLKVDSPYNTYEHKGLTPGPIANAGKESIEAVLNPADTDYLYFLAEYGTGDVYFAKTLEEHNALKKKHITDKRKEASE